MSAKKWNQMFLSESFSRFFEAEFCDQIAGTGVCFNVDCKFSIFFQKAHHFQQSELGLRFDEQNLVPVVESENKEMESRFNPFTIVVFNRV